MGDYTQNREDAIWNELGQVDGDEFDVEDIIERLNSSDFRTFGEGLSDVIRRKMPEDCELSEKAFLIKSYDEKNIQEDKEKNSYRPTSATINNWFNKNNRPKKSEVSRDFMYGIAFALNLTIEETIYLFHNVYLDRAFYSRNAKELIYYYCLKNGYSLERTKELIEKIEPINQTENDATVYTSIMQDIADNVSDDKDLINYINEHPHNFAIKDISAKSLLKKWMEKAKECVGNEYKIMKDNKVLREWCANANPESNDFMFQTITGQTQDAQKKGTTTLFGNTRLPKEINSCFPEAGAFSKKDPTSEELRKMIVLLFSYCFFYEVEKMIEKHGFENAPNFDDYKDELDIILNEAGMAPIYPGNPFDWMFCYCMIAEKPLNTFRMILDEARDI